jgi:outer membrane receptor protein involved in Fe transport
VIESSGTNYRNEQFYNFILGSDFYLNPRNTLTLSGNVAYEVEQQPSETNFSRTENGVLVSEWQRTEITSALNPKYQYDLQYKKVFKDTVEHTLLFSTLGKFFGKTQSSEFATRVLSGALEYPLQQTSTAFQQADYTFRLDYVKPFNKSWKLETGAQYDINNVGNNYEVRDFINEEWVTADSLTNNFEYKQRVLGVYSTGAYERDKWGVKLGLRVENTDLKTRLVTTQEKNNQLYTNFFPTLHTSYKVSRYISLQAGYSRRIHRPRLWDLNPFFNITNNFNIRRGNPDLRPEYTDSYELMSIYIFKKSSFNIGAYYRYTTEVIERVSIFENNVNTTLPMNIGTKGTFGVEFNAKYTPAKWFTVTADFNYNYFQRKGSFQDKVFDFFADKWTGKMTTRFKLSKNMDFELTGYYESREKTIQGTRLQTAYMDAGFRVKFLKGKGVIDFGARDIFATRLERIVIDQTDFYLYSFGQRGRYLTLGVSYGFGKGEAMTYSGGGHRH